MSRFWSLNSVAEAFTKWMQWASLSGVSAELLAHVMGAKIVNPIEMNSHFSSLIGTSWIGDGAITSIEQQLAHIFGTEDISMIIAGYNDSAFTVNSKSFKEGMEIGETDFARIIMIPCNWANQHWTLLTADRLQSKLYIGDGLSPARRHSESQFANLHHYLNLDRRFEIEMFSDYGNQCDSHSCGILLLLQMERIIRQTRKAQLLKPYQSKYCQDHRLRYSIMSMMAFTDLVPGVIDQFFGELYVPSKPIVSQAPVQQSRVPAKDSNVISGEKDLDETFFQDDDLIQPVQQLKKVYSGSDDYDGSEYSSSSDSDSDGLLDHKPDNVQVGADSRFSRFEPSAMNELFRVKTDHDALIDEVDDPGISLAEHTEILKSMPPDDRAKYLLEAGVNKQRVSFSSYRVEDINQTELEYDIDSVIWVGDTLPISCDIKIFPVPNRTATLTSTNHVTRLVNGSNVPLSTIPNFEFGSFGDFGMFRAMVMFPALRRRDTYRWVNIVSNDYYESFYQDILKPALELTVPSHFMGHYPLDYSITMSINRDKGKLKYPGYIVANEYLHILVENMRELAAEIDDFDGMFFMIYGKDMKLGTRGRNPVDTFLSKYSPFDRSLIQLDDLIMDFAIEIRSVHEARTMLTLNSSLEILLRQFGFVNFDHYRWCFTEDVQGLRAKMGANRVANTQLLFMQAYFVEKEILFSKSKVYEGGTSFSIKDAIHRTDIYSRSFETTRKAFEIAGNTSYPLRLEFRGSENCVRYLFDLGDEYWKRTLVESGSLLDLKTLDICEWKLARLEVYDDTLLRISQTFTEAGSNKLKLLLAAITCHFIKSLIVYPENGSVFKRLWNTSGANANTLRTNIPYINSNIAEQTLLIDDEEFEAIGYTYGLINKSDRRLHKIGKITNNREPLFMSFHTAKEVFHAFLASLLEKFPAPEKHLNVDNLPSELSTFERNSIVAIVKHPLFKKSRSTWRTRFEWFFSKDAINANSKWSQGWATLSYRKPYLDWLSNQSDQEQAMEDIWGMFRQLECLPDSTLKNKVWNTGKIVGQASIHVRFVENELIQGATKNETDEAPSVVDGSNVGESETIQGVGSGNIGDDAKISNVKAPKVQSAYKSSWICNCGKKFVPRRNGVPSKPMKSHQNTCKLYMKSKNGDISPASTSSDTSAETTTSETSPTTTTSSNRSPTNTNS
jgi:hypothetical protein